MRMREDVLLAYSLSHDEDVWRWSVYDVDGVTVADGAHATQAAAMAAVMTALEAGEAGLAA